MITVACDKCNKEIIGPASFCSSCGTPLPAPGETADCSASGAETTGDLNGDAKIDFEDFKIALSRSRRYASDKVDAAMQMARKKLQSAKEKDAAAVEDLAKQFESMDSGSKTGSDLNKDKFKSALISTIDLKFAEIMASKKDSEAFLTYIDAQIMTSKVRAIFKNLLPVIPPQVEAACLLSEAVLAPSTKEKENRIKAAVGIAGGTTGIGMIIGAVGSALGWGAGIITTFAAWIAGSSVAGPIAWGVAGLSLAVVAGYFASTSNQLSDTERFLRVLKSSTDRAVDAIWAKYETELAGAVTQASAPENS